jgi:hypothetical protein
MSLPSSLVGMVFSNLTIQEAARCWQVCKAWRQRSQVRDLLVGSTADGLNKLRVVETRRVTALEVANCVDARALKQLQTDLEPLTQMPLLAKLDLYRARVRPEAASVLGRVRSLTCLSIGMNHDLGDAAVSALKPLTKLRDLNLRLLRKITDKSVVSLSATCLGRGCAVRPFTICAGSRP